MLGYLAGALENTAQVGSLQAVDKSALGNNGRIHAGFLMSDLQSSKVTEELGARLSRNPARETSAKPLAREADFNTKLGRR